MSAQFSADMLYRYTLDREGPGNGTTLFVMANPSTADDTLDDATIRKVRGFGRVNDLGKLLIGNLFAYRATDINELKNVSDPVGCSNDYFLDEMMEQADRVVFAWGRLAKFPRSLRHRWMDVYKIAKGNGHEPLCLGVGADGHPRHPLMLPYSTPLETWKL